MFDLGIISYRFTTTTTVSKTITIDHTQCGSSDSTNFTVLVSLSDNSLKTTTNGGSVQNANGYDIRFYSDSGYTTLLNWETESYDSTSGKCIFWVKIPTVSHTTDTVFYMKYGDATVTTFQGGSIGSAWSSNYQAVWHLSDAATGAINDSTSNGINGVPTSVSTTTGKIGNAAKFTGGTSNVSFPTDMAAFNSVKSLSTSMWVQVTSFSNFDCFLTKMTPGAYYNDFLVFQTGGVLYTQVDNGSDGEGYVTISSTDFITNKAHVVSTYDGTGTTNADRLKIYVNGVQQTLTIDYTVPSVTADETGFNQYMGWYNTINSFDGVLDEVRVNATTLSPDWITTEYNNQNNPGNIGSPGFLTIT